MGQVEILEVLEKSKLPMAGKQIAEAVGQSWQGHIDRILKKLLDRAEIRCIELNRHQALKHFGSKRKLRLYYINTLNKREVTKAKTTLSYL